MNDNYQPEHRAGDEPVMQDNRVDESLPAPASLLFNNRAYELVRAATQVVLPGLATLYFTVAQIVGLPWGAEVTAITAAVCTFLGLLLSVSRRQYENSDARFDGAVVLTPEDGGDSTGVNFQVDTAAVVEKNAVTLKVVDRQ